MYKEIKNSVLLTTVVSNILLLVLALFAVITKIYSFPFILGVAFSLSGVFLLIILKLYNINIALVVAIIAQLTGIISPDYPYWCFIFVLEIACIGLYTTWRPKNNLIFGDLLFWIFVGIPLSALAYYTLFYNGSWDAYIMRISADIICSLSSCAFVDALLTYVPTEKLLKKQEKTDDSVQFLKFLFLFISIILSVIILSTFIISGFNTYSEVNEKNQRIVKDYLNDIRREINAMDKNQQAQLMFYGVLQTGELEELIEKIQSEKKADIIITDINDKVVATNIDKMKHGQVFDWQKYGLTMKESEGVYAFAPYKKYGTIETEAWSEGSYFYTRDIGLLDLKLTISFPIKQIQQEILNSYVSKFKLVMSFVIFSLVVTLLTNRLLVKSIKKLSAATTAVPMRIRNAEQIEWPHSKIYEVKQLITNFKDMSDNFKKMFMESEELNKTLALQADELLKSEEKLHKLAYYDTLTNLPNRLMFKMYLEEKLQMARKNNNIIGVIFIDLNQFKKINDTMGHSAGDDLLVIFSERFVSIKNDNTEVFRLGGDEFVFVVSAEEENQVKLFGQEVAKIFIKPVELLGASLNVTGSIGISMYPKDGQDLDTLVKYADLAMYRSKEMGGCNIEYFNKEMNKDFEEYMILETGIKKALESNEFELHYQPKINAQTGEITSCEALIRWKRLDLGYVSPIKFIPIAEKSGLIFQIDQWVINEACRQNSEWQLEGRKKIPISVNVSAKHFFEGKLIDVVKEALRNNSIEPKYLKLEITEGVLIKDKQFVADIIKQLAELGVLVSLDDFGTGYSSFSHLFQLPISELKLDREFIQGLDKDDKKGAMAKIMIEFAHNLELNVVAEGIETLEEYKFLQGIKCDELQGYFFSKPVKKEEFKELITATDIKL